MTQIGNGNQVYPAPIHAGPKPNLFLARRIVGLWIDTMFIHAVLSLGFLFCCMFSGLIVSGLIFIGVSSKGESAATESAQSDLLLDPANHGQLVVPDQESANTEATQAKELSPPERSANVEQVSLIGFEPNGAEDSNDLTTSTSLTQENTLAACLTSPPFSLAFSA